MRNVHCAVCLVSSTIFVEPAVGLKHETGLLYSSTQVSGVYSVKIVITIGFYYGAGELS